MDAEEAPLVILLAEDSSEDEFLVRHQLKRAGFSGIIHRVRDGQEAISYLNGKQGFEDREAFPLPDLIVTDLKMPRLDGFQLIRWLKQRAELARLPVLVLSSSNLEADLQKARELGVCAYLTKDILMGDGTRLLQELQTAFK